MNQARDIFSRALLIQAPNCHILDQKSSVDRRYNRVSNVLESAFEALRLGPQLVKSFYSDVHLKMCLVQKTSHLRARKEYFTFSLSHEKQK